jgi:hypothetical protein
MHSLRPLLLPFLPLLLFVACNGLGESLPEGQKGKEAEQLAERMLDSIDHEAWDSTRYVAWSFTGNSYLWDKERHLVRVEWNDKKVLLDPDRVDGKAYEEGKQLPEEEEKEAVQSAWERFCNDSYWLNAPSKVFDPGTERRLVKSEEGEDRLLVTYTSGGVTPGDSYLWILDETGRPERYKMWVSKIPIGGVKASWEKWDTLSTGALIAREHDLFIGSFRIKDLKAAQDLTGMGLDEDPFLPLEKKER